MTSQHGTTNKKPATMLLQTRYGSFELETTVGRASALDETKRRLQALDTATRKKPRLSSSSSSSDDEHLVFDDSDSDEAEERRMAAPSDDEAFFEQYGELEARLSRLDEDDAEDWQRLRGRILALLAQQAQLVALLDEERRATQALEAVRDTEHKERRRLLAVRDAAPFDVLRRPFDAVLADFQARQRAHHQRMEAAVRDRPRVNNNNLVRQALEEQGARSLSRRALEALLSHCSLPALLSLVSLGAERYAWYAAELQGYTLFLARSPLHCYYVQVATPLLIDCRTSLPPVK